MGVAPEAMAEIFESRLKKIDKYLFVLLCASIVDFFHLRDVFLFFECHKPPSRKRGKFMLL
jgi:hypothetical protein